MNSQLPAEIAAIRQSHARLTELVEGLDPAALTGEAYPSEWSIAQVLSHLGSQAEIAVIMSEAGLNGTAAPGREEMEPIWAEWNAKSAEAQARDSIESNERFLALLDGLDGDQIESYRMQFLGSEVDLAGFGRLRLSEHAVHSWDISVALDPSAKLALDAVELLVDHLGMVAGWSGKPSPEPYRVLVVTTDPARQLLVSVADAVSVAPYDDADGSPVNGTVEMPAEAFIRLVYGRLDPDHTPPVKESGSRGLSDLRPVFPGF